MSNFSTAAKKRSHLKRRFFFTLHFLFGRKFREEFFKRNFDIFFSTTILVLISPFIMLISILIKCSSKGPIIFSQERLGRANTVFKCYKFRTMYVDAESRLEDILNSSPHLKNEWIIHQKLKKDPRITTIGKFLRKTSLDELPQFLNVLKGELSVVGPRPYMIFQKKELGNRAKIILSVRPGITGLWQTSGRSLLPFQKRIELDADYVKKRSFIYDLKLIVKTIPALFCNNNAC